MGIIYLLARHTSLLVRGLLPGWVLYISLFNLSISNALGLYLSMIAVFRRRYYELLLYALLNPIYGSCTQSLLTWLCGNFYKTPTGKDSSWY